MTKGYIFAYGGTAIVAKARMRLEAAPEALSQLIDRRHDGPGDPRRNHIVIEQGEMRCDIRSTSHSASVLFGHNAPRAGSIYLAFDMIYAFEIDGARLARQSSRAGSLNSGV